MTSESAASAIPSERISSVDWMQAARDDPDGDRPRVDGVRCHSRPKDSALYASIGAQY